MINKQNLWFITLFSLILVLSIYYLTLGEDSLSNLKVDVKENNSEVVVSESNDTLVALKVADEEVTIAKIEELQAVLLSNDATLEEKNHAYDELQTMNKNESMKEAITKLIKENYKLDSFVKIDGNNINITISSSEHDVSLANNIIRSVQELYSDNKYITVKFNN